MSNFIYLGNTLGHREWNVFSAELCGILLSDTQCAEFFIFMVEIEGERRKWKKEVNKYEIDKKIQKIRICPDDP